MNTDILSEEDRHHGLHFLEYNFIPEFIDDYNHGQIDEKWLIEIDRWPNMFHTVYNDEYKVEWDQLAVSTNQEEINGKICILYTFPSPNEIPEAKFGIVLFDKAKHIAEYYTMELSYDNWVLGQKTVYMHSNYGTIGQDATLETFKKRISEIKSDTQHMMLQDDMENISDLFDDSLFDVNTLSPSNDCSDKRLVFSIECDELDKYKTFRKNHVHNDDATPGDHCKISFCDSGNGIIASVECLICGEEEILTEADEW